MASGQHPWNLGLEHLDLEEKFRQQTTASVPAYQAKNLHDYTSEDEISLETKAKEMWE